MADRGATDRCLEVSTLGIEFIEKAAKSHRKGYDQKAAALATPGLFTKPVDAPQRAYSARLAEGQCAAAGEHLVVRQLEDSVTLMRDHTPVATLVDQDAAVGEALSASGGVAGAEVTDVLDISGRLEVTLC